MSESQLMNDIIVAASVEGHRAFANPVGFYKRSYKGRAYGIHYGVGGTNSPDLWVPCRDGILAIAEVKVPGEKPRKGQMEWMFAMKLAIPLVRVGWVDSVSGALRLFSGAETDPKTLYVHA